ncbi:MAG: hypothetical protein V5A62_03370 [Haloarculaceae archaeon]
MSPGVTLDRLVETVQRDLQRGITAADERSAELGGDPFAVTSVELVVPFEATVRDPDGDTTFLLGVGDGEGRLTLRYRPVPAAELVRVVAADPELSDPRGRRLSEHVRPLTVAAAERLAESGLVDVGSVAAADPGELKRLLRGTPADAGLVALTAALADLGASPVTAELLARAGTTPAMLVEAGPGEAFDRLRAAVEGHPDRVPADYGVDYAELDALVAAADR